MDKPSKRVIEEWGRRIQAEYNSALLTARILLFLKEEQFSPHLIALCERIVQDELQHTKKGIECLISWGVATPLVPEDIVLPTKIQKLTDPIFYIVSAFVVGETSAVPLFEKMYEKAQDQSAKATLKQIIKDEKMHSSFGWQVLDALLKNSTQKLQDEIQKSVRQAIQKFWNGYARKKNEVILEPESEKYGLIDGQAYRNTWLKCYHEIICLRLKERGFVYPNIEELRGNDG